MNLALILLKTEPAHPLFDAVPNSYTWFPDFRRRLPAVVLYEGGPIFFRQGFGWRASFSFDIYYQFLYLVP